jgi:hypothetical protein
MLTRIFALTLALLSMTAPAHAAFIETLDADLSLNFPTLGLLTGNIQLTPQDDGHAAAHLGPWEFIQFQNFSLNGTPLVKSIAPVASAGPVPGVVALLALPVPGPPPSESGPQYDFIINTAFLPPNPTYSDFGLRPYSGPYTGDPTATSGTVTVLSETLATPLPAALPLVRQWGDGAGGFYVAT